MLSANSDMAACPIENKDYLEEKNAVHQTAEQRTQESYQQGVDRKRSEVRVLMVEERERKKREEWEKWEGLFKPAVSAVTEVVNRTFLTFTSSFDIAYIGASFRFNPSPW